jgi:chromate transporter
MKPDALGVLALHFVLLSLLAVGGANAVVPDMHRLAVETHHWLSDREFADLFALANAAPGPNVLIVSLIGFKIAGLPGGLVATVSMCGPSSLVSFFTARLWQRFKDAPWRSLVQQALAPVSVGLILASGWILSVTADIGWIGAAITATVAVSLLTTKLNPLWLLAAAALLGAVGIA